ncbi:MAG: LptF/LptG family permease [Sphaerochaetaceae bacterium]|jgi:lipopolysaccharide export system permease protein
MKRLDRYIVGSLLKMMLFSLLLISFVIVLFDTFKQLDVYMNQGVSYKEIGTIALLFFPQAAVWAIGPSLLFAATYFLSSLHANNEMLILSNCGYPYRRIIMPILVVALVFVSFQFALNEYGAIPLGVRKQQQQEQLIGSTTLNDNQDISLLDPGGTYLIHAKRYLEQPKTLVGVTVVFLDEKGDIEGRVDAQSASFNGSYWVLYDATVHQLNAKELKVASAVQKEYHNEHLKLEPELFRNLIADVNTMPLRGAFSYLKRLETIHMSQYTVLAVDVYDRIGMNFIPLVLVLIACMTQLRWKKNLLVLSIVASLVIAIVYFVLHMVSIILAKQGVITPIWGVMGPIVVLFFLSLPITLLQKGNA